MRQKSSTHLTAAAALLLTLAILAPIDHACGEASAAKISRWGADYFPNVPLTTQDGTTVQFYDDLLKGKAVVIDLIYTHCQDLCPLETARLARVQRLLGDRVGKDIFFYSISIDPTQDTPQVLKAYAEKFHVGPGWLFLTGKKEDITLISKKLGLSSLTDAANRDGHLPSLMIGNEATGQWMRHSAVDNPQFLAVTIGNFLHGWHDHTVEPSYAAVPPIPTLDPGAYLFRTRCAACHTVGQGDQVGPDLLGVTRRRERAWLARYVRVPDLMRAEHDAIALALSAQYENMLMPNLRLSEADVAALLTYLEAQNTAFQTRARPNALPAP
jgi:protein SCO1/2